MSRRTRVPSSRACAWRDKRLQTKTKRKPVTRHRHRVHGRYIAFLPRLDLANRSGVDARRANDALAVLQLELLLNRFSVAGRRRDVDNPARIGDTEVREEHTARAGASCKRREHLIPLPEPGRAQVLDLFLSLHPPVSRDDDDVVLLDDEIVGGVLGLTRVALNQRAPFVAVGLLNLLQLRSHELPAAGFVLQQACDLTGALALLLEFVPDDENLESRQAVDFQLQDGVGLFSVEIEALHDLLGGVSLAVRLSDHADDLVEGVEDGLESLEDMDPLFKRRELVLEPFRDDVETEVQEVPEDLLEVQPRRTADLGVLGVGHQTREVHREIDLQRGVLEEVRHHHLLVGVLFHLDRNSNVFGREIFDVEERRQLAAYDHLSDPLDELRLVDGVRNAVDVNGLGRTRFRTDVPRSA